MLKFPADDRVRQIHELFDSYAAGAEVLAGDALATFLRDLGVDACDARLLVFCCDCNAKEMGAFSREEFVRGMLRNDATSVKELDPQRWEHELVNWPQRVFRYAGVYARLNPNDYLERDVALDYLELFFAAWGYEDLRNVQNALLRFLRTLPETTRITKDAWNSIVELLLHIRRNQTYLTDFNIDESFWPPLIDDFIQWYNSGAEEGKGEHLG